MITLIYKFIIIDSLILFLNVNYFFFIQFNYKKIDSFFIKLNSKSFYQISNYLNNKYQILYQKKYNKEQFINKTISLFFINYHDFDPDHLILINKTIELLKKKYYVNINPYNPDYLIYNIFGCNHLDPKYNNSIKIAFYTENQIPDFSIADYCIGHSHLNYLDRYLKLPIYFVNRLFFKKNEIEVIRKKVLKNPLRKKFCAALISNNITTDNFRLDFINELNKYKEIDMGGLYRNNVGYIKNKLEFLSLYKFSIAMENTEGDGYLSEKILDAFLSGTIPIYYGDYMLDEYINPETFILIKGKKDIKAKIEYIKQIDNNSELYRHILKKKLFLRNEYLGNQFKKEFIEFFEHIFSQNKINAKRIDNYYSPN